jgi:hypothetical protein
MLVRITAVVEQVGEAYQIVDLGRLHRIGAVIGELLEEIEREHPGVATLQHIITVRSEPTKGEPNGPIVIK